MHCKLSFLQLGQFRREELEILTETRKTLSEQGREEYGTRT
jgi:hypothetical protein